MPRPEIPEHREIPDLLPQLFMKAQVDAPDASYEMVIARLDGLTLAIDNRNGDQIGSYVFDEAPVQVHGSLVGLVDGVPLVVSEDPGCTCVGSKKRMKREHPAG